MSAGSLVSAATRATGVAARAAAGSRGKVLRRSRLTRAHRKNGEQFFDVAALALRAARPRAARDEHLETAVAAAASVLEERHAHILISAPAIELNIRRRKPYQSLRWQHFSYGSSCSSFAGRWLCWHSFCIRSCGCSFSRSGSWELPSTESSTFSRRSSSCPRESWAGGGTLGSRHERPSTPQPFLRNSIGVIPRHLLKARWNAAGSE